MKLKSFRVKKFRNVVDSGEIVVDSSVTCLVGKNEAGKSALLEALYLFNPAYEEGFELDEQYPRWLVATDRRKEDLADFAPIEVTLELDSSDAKAVQDAVGAPALNSNTIVVQRRYSGGTIWTVQYQESGVVEALKDHLPTSVKGKAKKISRVTDLKKLFDSLSETVDDDDALSEEDLAESQSLLKEWGLAEKTVWRLIVDELSPRLPKFFRFTSYSTLPGRIDFRELATGADDGPGRTSLQTARSLLALAGTDLDQLGDESYELRRSELEAVQIDLTRQVFEYWKQNPDLEVLIDVDKETVQRAGGQAAVARFLDIRLRDKRTGYSNNFEQRSAGFQWFFSFLAAFSEFEESGERPVVLLDEPALTLHGKAQADFLRFIDDRLASAGPVLYTTHSPFMVQPGKLERVRVVEDLGPPKGAVASSKALVADPDSLFPLQAALGYDIAQNLFVGPNNLVVEGTSDFIYLTVMSEHLERLQRSSLDKRWRILPAGGATNIPTFVALIGPHLDITVLADSDTKGMQKVSGLVDRGLLKRQRLILASNVVENPKADIEDLFSEGDYLKLYNRCFGKKVKVSTLPKGSRVVKRLESSHGEYDHGEPAEILLRWHHEINFSQTTLKNFEALIDRINESIGKNP